MNSLSQPKDRGVAGAPTWPGVVEARFLNTTLGRYGLLLALGLVYFFAFEFTKWQPRPGQLSVPVSLLPIPPVVWFSMSWLLFGLLLWALAQPFRAADTLADDRWMRRIAILACVLVYVIELLARLQTVGFFGLERRLDPQVLGLGLLVAALAGGAVLIVLLYRPPSSRLLLIAMVAAGLGLRALWLILVRPDPAHSDNMFVIYNGLERLVSGRMPYAFFEFQTHSNPMPYLPWTFLSYLPPFVAGLDLRVTNLVLSLGLLVALLAVIRRFRLPSAVTQGLSLVLGVFYLLPLSVSLDVETEFQMFNLMLVLTFAAIALGHFRWAAVCFGISLGAMPVALYCAIPLAFFIFRTQSWRERIILGSLVLVFALFPVMVFMIWDAQAFLWAVSYVLREAWASLDTGQGVLPYEWPYSLFWHALGSGLRFVQAAVLIFLAGIAWKRLQTIPGLIVLSAAGYLLLVLSGPYIGPHLLQVVIYLAALGEAVLWTGAKGLQGSAPAARAAEPLLQGVQ